MADNTVGQRTIYEWEGRWRFRPSGYTTQLVAFLLCYSFPRKHMGVDPNDLDLSPFLIQKSDHTSSYVQ